MARTTQTYEATVATKVVHGVSGMLHAFAQLDEPVPPKVAKNLADRLAEAHHVLAAAARDRPPDAASNRPEAPHA
jgi:hypothetical protein